MESDLQEGLAIDRQTELAPPPRSVPSDAVVGMMLIAVKRIAMLLMVALPLGILCAPGTYEWLRWTSSPKEDAQGTFVRVESYQLKNTVYEMVFSFRPRGPNAAPERVRATCWYDSWWGRPDYQSGQQVKVTYLTMDPGVAVIPSGRRGLPWSEWYFLAVQALLVWSLWQLLRTARRQRRRLHAMKSGRVVLAHRLDRDTNTFVSQEGVCADLRFTVKNATREQPVAHALIIDEPDGEPCPLDDLPPWLEIDERGHWTSISVRPLRTYLVIATLTVLTIMVADAVLLLTLLSVWLRS